MKKISVLCKKDLFHKNGTQWFSKDKIYVGRNFPDSDNLGVLIVTNDLGEPHMLWSNVKFFKIFS